MYKVVILAAVYFISTYASCNKGVDCPVRTYSFSTDIRAYSDLDSISINDTIWLELKTPTRLTDIRSGVVVEYNNAVNLSTSINFFEFVGGSISNPGSIAAVNAFEYKLIFGVFLPDGTLPEQNRDYRFTEVNNEYRFKLGIVPKRVGIFSFSPSNSATVRRSNDRCSEAGFSITFANTNQHLYFYEQNRPGYIPSGYEQTHMYCFKVK
jgi:hypothetical protein